MWKIHSQSCLSSDLGSIFPGMDLCIPQEVARPCVCVCVPRYQFRSCSDCEVQKPYSALLQTMSPIFGPALTEHQGLKTI